MNNVLHFTNEQYMDVFSRCFSEDFLLENACVDENSGLVCMYYQGKNWHSLPHPNPLALNITTTNRNQS